MHWRDCLQGMHLRCAGLFFDALIIVGYYLMFAWMEAVADGEGIYYLLVCALWHLGYEIFIVDALGQLVEACPEDEDPEDDAEYEFELFHVLEGILYAVMFELCYER